MAPSSCVVCRKARSKCVQECIFAQCFSGDNEEKFGPINKYWTKFQLHELLTAIPVERRVEPVDSLYQEVQQRAADNVLGSTGVINVLRAEVADLKAENKLLKDLLAAQPLSAYSAQRHSTVVCSNLRPQELLQGNAHDLSLSLTPPSGLALSSAPPKILFSNYNTISGIGRGRRNQIGKITNKKKTIFQNNLTNSLDHVHV